MHVRARTHTHRHTQRVWSEARATGTTKGKQTRGEFLNHIRMCRREGGNKGGRAGRGRGDFPHRASNVSSSCTCAAGWSSGLCCTGLHTSINLILTPPLSPFPKPRELHIIQLLLSFFSSLLNAALKEASGTRSGVGWRHRGGLAGRGTRRAHSQEGGWSY